jgi:adenylosuccinate lyase
MATEELIVRSVRAGGDRQQAHEIIRGHSIAAARAVKDEGRSNDMLERLAADRKFNVSIEDMQSLMDPMRFIGRAPQQVDEFIAEVVDPILAGAAPASATREEVRV